MGASNPVTRVLMTADTLGGVWTYALDLARGLERYGVEVALATMGSPLTAQQARDAAAIANLQVYESTYKLEWMSDPWPDVERASDWLLALENDLEPDAVHLNGYAHGDLPWRAPHFAVGHSCVLSWWRAVKGEEAPGEWSRYKLAVTRGLRACDVVVAPTRAMLAELRRHYGPLRSTAVIANGRRSQSYYVAVKQPFILSAGRLWDEAKNVSLLGRVRPAIDWPVCVAGESRHPDGRTADLGDLKLLGALEPGTLASWYARASIYCLPARYEPFGLSVLEAALSGCALVLGDIPSLRENWDGAALFAPPEDAEAFEWHLRELIGNRHLRESLAARARYRAASFTADRMAKAYVSLYSRLRQRTARVMAAGD